MLRSIRDDCSICLDAVSQLSGNADGLVRAPLIKCATVDGRDALRDGDAG